jgi:hypothetical protein
MGATSFSAACRSFKNNSNVEPGKSRRWSRHSRSALVVGRPRRDRYDDHRQRENHREPKRKAIWFACQAFPLNRPKSLCRTLKGRIMRDV